jgi:hypothetical protein
MAAFPSLCLRNSILGLLSGHLYETAVWFLLQKGGTVFYPFDVDLQELFLPTLSSSTDGDVGLTLLQILLHARQYSSS